MTEWTFWCATWVHDMSGHGEGAAVMQGGADSRYIPPAPSEAQNANKNCPVCQQETETAPISEIRDPFLGRSVERSSILQKFLFFFFLTLWVSDAIISLILAPQSSPWH